MLIFLFLQYWDIDKPLIGWAKSIFCHCFFDRKIFVIDVPPINCYNNAIFYRTIETIHRWICRTVTLFWGQVFEVNEKVVVDDVELSVNVFEKLGNFGFYIVLIKYQINIDMC